MNDAGPGGLRSAAGQVAAALQAATLQVAGPRAAQLSSSLAGAFESAVGSAQSDPPRLVKVALKRPAHARAGRSGAQGRSGAKAGTKGSASKAQAEPPLPTQPVATDRIEIDSLRASVDLRDMGDGRLSVQASADGIRAVGYLLDAASVTLDGSLPSHTFKLAVSGAGQKLQASGTGRFDPGGYAPPPGSPTSATAGHADSRNPAAAGSQAKGADGKAVGKPEGAPAQRADGKGTEGNGTEGKAAEGKAAEGKGAEGKGAEGKGAEGKGGASTGPAAGSEDGTAGQASPRAAADPARTRFEQEQRSRAAADAVKARREQGKPQEDADANPSANPTPAEAAAIAADRERAARRAAIRAQSDSRARPMLRREWSWDGKVGTLDVTGAMQTSIRHPVSLSVKPNAYLLEDLDAALAGGRLRIASARFEEGRVNAKGDFEDIEVSRLMEGYDRWKPGAIDPEVIKSIDFLTRGKFDMAGTRVDDLSGMAQIDVTSRALSSTSRADVQVASGNLSGKLQLQVPTLAWTRPLLGSDWRVDGQLGFDGTVGGRIDAPRLSGTLNGDKLQLQQKLLGWRLGDGVLVGRFEGDRLTLEKMHFTSANGSVDLSGRLNLPASAAASTTSPATGRSAGDQGQQNPADKSAPKTAEGASNKPEGASNPPEGASNKSDGASIRPAEGASYKAPGGAPTPAPESAAKASEPAAKRPDQAAGHPTGTPDAGGGTAAAHPGSDAAAGAADGTGAASGTPPGGAKGGAAGAMAGGAAPSRRLIDLGQGEFVLKLDHLPLSIGPGQRVVLSGSTPIRIDHDTVRWTGEIGIDEGLVELHDVDAPANPADLVIIDRKRGQKDPEVRLQATGAHEAGATNALPVKMIADLTVDVGQKLRITGNGVDAWLRGSVRITGELPGAPRADGTVTIRDGRYRGYGQDLDIRRGRIVFSGPIDDPALDIVAVRRYLPVEAGVQISGTAQAPRIRLVSTPDVPDAEKLSWMVLGVPLSDAGGGTVALKAAAVALFGNSDSAGAGGFSGLLGLDVLGVGASSGTSNDSSLPTSFTSTGIPGVPGQSGTSSSTSTAQQNVVTVGKRLSSKLFVSYEQGLQGVWNLLKVQYDISRRLSVRASTGTESAVDFLYFHSFD